MLMKRSFFSDLTAVKTQSFDIVAAFETLDPKRQLVLCDQLFHSGPMTYKNTVKLLWPQSSDIDAKILEKYLRSQAMKAAA
jgi:hypothetical protein